MQITQLLHSLDGEGPQRAVHRSSQEIVILIHHSVAILCTEHCSSVRLDFRVLLMSIDVLCSNGAGHQSGAFEVKLPRGFGFGYLGYFG